MVSIVNLLASGGSAVMVLFAQEKLGLDAVGFGLLFSYGVVPLGSLLGGVLARSFGLRAPFLVAGMVIPVAAILCLPAVNARTIAEARAAAGLGPGVQPSGPAPRTYIRSGASTPIRARVLASTWRVLLTSHQRALERAWSSVRTRHSA
jgi:hypothetical protein